MLVKTSQLHASQQNVLLNKLWSETSPPETSGLNTNNSTPPVPRPLETGVLHVSLLHRELAWVPGQRSLSPLSVRFRRDRTQLPQFPQAPAPPPPPPSSLSGSSRPGANATALGGQDSSTAAFLPSPEHGPAAASSSVRCPNATHLRSQASRISQPFPPRAPELAGGRGQRLP